MVLQYFIDNPRNVLNYYRREYPVLYSSFVAVGNSPIPLILNVFNSPVDTEKVGVNVLSERYQPVDEFYQFYEPVQNKVLEMYLSSVGSNFEVIRYENIQVERDKVVVDGSVTYEYYDFITHEIPDLKLYPNILSTMRRVFSKYLLLQPGIFSRGINVISTIVSRDGNILFPVSHASKRYIGSVVPITTKLYYHKEVPRLSEIIQDSIVSKIGELGVNLKSYVIGYGFDYMMMGKPVLFCVTILDITLSDVASFLRGIGSRYIPIKNLINFTISPIGNINDIWDLIDQRVVVAPNLQKYYQIAMNTIDFTYHSLFALISLYKFLINI